MTEKENVTSEAIEAEKLYELRGLEIDDVFPMVQVINKIGWKQFKSCFGSDEVKKAITTLGTENGVSVEALGLSVMLDVAGIIFENLEHCRKDLYLLLSRLSGMEESAIGKLPMYALPQMILDICKDKSFADFFGVVFKLLK